MPASFPLAVRNTKEWQRLFPEPAPFATCTSILAWARIALMPNVVTGWQQPLAPGCEEGVDPIPEPQRGAVQAWLRVALGLAEQRSMQLSVEQIIRLSVDEYRLLLDHPLQVLRAADVEPYRRLGEDPRERDFLAALADPASDPHLPLVYADWLEARGDPRHAWIRRFYSA